MKKLLVHTFLIVGSALIFGAAANAQSYRAQIPFDFEAAGVQYTAGEYFVGRLSPEARTSLALRDSKTGKRKLLGLLRENVERQVHARLVFLKSDGHYTLTEIATPDFGFKANLKRSNYGIGKVGAPKPEAVSVNLN